MTITASSSPRQSKTIASYGRVDLLCIDELGHLELDRRGVEMPFQVLTEREEKSSTDPRLCAAIVDRLTFNGAIIETGTESHCLAQTKAKLERTQSRSA